MWSLIRSATRAGRLTVTVLAVLVLLLAAWWTAGTSVGVGFATPFLTSWLAVVAVAAVVSTPLAPSFGALEATMVRERRSRLVRGLMTTPLILASFVVFSVVDRAGTLAPTLLLLMAVGFVASAVFPELASVATLSTGALFVMADHVVLNHPLSSAIGRLHDWGAAVLLLCALVLYVVGLRGRSSWPVD